MAIEDSELIDASFTFVNISGIQQAKLGPLERQFPASVQKQSIDVSDSPTAWLAAHLKEVTAKYAGKWILVHRGAVVAASKEPSKLEKRADQENMDNPLIAEIGKEPAVWKTAYAPFHRFFPPLRPPRLPSSTAKASRGRSGSSARTG